MTDLTKKTCIATLEKHGWTYKGFLDAGWGEKFHTFKVKGETGYRTMKLAEMRRKAYDVEMQQWFAQQSS